MMVVLWSVKGGQGTTVTAALCALGWSSAEHEVLLVDLGGDLPGALGLSEPPGPGCVDWLLSGGVGDREALRRLEVPVTEGLRLLPRGPDPLDMVKPLAQFPAALASDSRLVVVDCGERLRSDQAGLGLQLATAADHSWLVTRSCYLALTKLAEPPVEPDAVILLAEPGRALGRHDVEAVAGATVVAQVAVDPGVARSVDAGLLRTRLPRRLNQMIRAIRPND
jgi:cellulose biosynthesis protein BcsQ